MQLKESKKERSGGRMLPDFLFPYRKVPNMQCEPRSAWNFVGGILFFKPKAGGVS